VSTAAGLVGLLLALVTLFTAAQAQALNYEIQQREGGADSKRLHFIRNCAAGLFVVTLLTIISLAQLFWDICTSLFSHWAPILGVFNLIWLLLVVLGVWQLLIFKGTFVKLEVQDGNQGPG
jgi:hypothetical protein